jgi:hypothetical protein
MINETVFNGRDNAVWVGLRVNKTLIDLDEVTRMQLLISGTVYDSDALGSGDSAVFDWTQGDGILILRLGNLGISSGFYNAELVVFSDDNPNGVLWDTLRLRFK